MAGALEHLRVLEFAGIGPAPFTAMLLADLGAEVVRVVAPDRAALLPISDEQDVLLRNRSSLVLDLKHPPHLAQVLELVSQAEVLIEGFRPGVMERLGLSPERCLEINPRLVYGRMTGWGQDGPLAQRAGHDITYLALSGVLHAIGPAGSAPVPPLNLVADFGGGGLLLAFGLLAAVLSARQTGHGQVVDAAMVEGSSLLAAMAFSFKAAGLMSNHRGSNLLDGGAPFYRTYACADGRYLAIGALEHKFYARLLELCQCVHAEQLLAEQFKPQCWDQHHRWLEQLFATKTRDQWAALLEPCDACAAPVLSWDEAPHHPQAQARASFHQHNGHPQPAPAPRFSRTPSSEPQAHGVRDIAEVLARWQQP